MCFELDSAPPIPVLSGAAVSHHELELEAADGNRFAAFAAEPEDPTGACVVILPDVRGLYRFYEELALHFAERGHRAIAIDYFGRTAGVGKRGETSNTGSTCSRRPRRASRRMCARPSSGCAGRGAARFTVGFCFGGHHSWLGAAGGHGLAGAIGFYGTPGERDGRHGPIQRAGEMEAPILALQAGGDANITAEANEEFERALEAAGVEHELVSYDGAPHSFFDRKQEDFQRASDEAWNRVLDFIARQTP